MADIVLDTHVLLWWQNDATLLSADANTAIDSAESIGVSPISFWEVAMLVRKQRVGLDRPVVQWCEAIAADERVEVVPITAAIAGLAGSLEDLHGDPADRLICAAAMTIRSPLLSKDGKISTFATGEPQLQVVW